MKWQETYEPVIGLEVHVELKTASKMFCGCVNNPFHAEKPNQHTCPVCLGMPGGLPVPNKKAIEWAVKIGLAAGCKINEFSKFDRKHYFYPDLAKGYQISQHDAPFCYQGKIETSAGTVGINRIHLEEDTGKLLHTDLKGKKISLIDFNRSGVPLVEIVTEPDIIDGQQAKEFGKKLRQLLRFLDVADCDMEQGGMRLEANISLRKKGAKGLPNYKVEVKNINSFRFLEQAINYELVRQAEILDAGKTPAQETRGWNSVKNVTTAQRNKEAAEDYRYFPDPDIPPFRLTEKNVSDIKASLPRLPEEMLAGWQKKYQLSPTQLSFVIAPLTSAAEFNWLEQCFEAIQTKSLDVKLFVNDLINKKLSFSADKKPELTVEAFAAFHTTEAIDIGQLEASISKILAANPDAVEKYHAGQQQVFGFLMGQILKTLEQKVDPKAVREALQAALEG